MEFVVDTAETNLVPEKIPELSYSPTFDAFVATFQSARQLHRFLQFYGKALIIPAEEDYELPKLVFQQEE